MNTIQCNKCQCKNTTDAKFCRGCNGKICSVCHKTNDHDATFCVYCGKILIPQDQDFEPVVDNTYRKNDSNSIIKMIVYFGAIGIGLAIWFFIMMAIWG